MMPARMDLRNSFASPREARASASSKSMGFRYMPIVQPIGELLYCRMVTTASSRKPKAMTIHALWMESSLLNRRGKAKVAMQQTKCMATRSLMNLASNAVRLNMFITT